MPGLLVDTRRRAQSKNVPGVLSAASGTNGAARPGEAVRSWDAEFRNRAHDHRGAASRAAP
jgi:hypothetical protein